MPVGPDREAGGRIQERADLAEQELVLKDAAGEHQGVQALRVAEAADRLDHALAPPVEGTRDVGQLREGRGQHDRAGPGSQQRFRLGGKLHEATHLAEVTHHHSEGLSLSETCACGAWLRPPRCVRRR